MSKLTYVLTVTRDSKHRRTTKLTCFRDGEFEWRKTGGNAHRSAAALRRHGRIVELR